MDLEWDEEKRESNLAKHGVDFARAGRIFENPILAQIDKRQDYGEERVIALGHVDWFFMIVVYVWRNSKCRIISARKASSYDKERYYSRFFGKTSGDGGPDTG